MNDGAKGRTIREEMRRETIMEEENRRGKEKEGGRRRGRGKMVKLNKEQK